ncbi:unnamed protein product [Meloidogyne enterolobii]|uniref:Uncharacterized protein n=1 Tax=Meloidogyne enterolobii TaxID=390850 RepID=A0ACB0Z830_MELEN
MNLIYSISIGGLEDSSEFARISGILEDLNVYKKGYQGMKESRFYSNSLLVLI